MYLPALRTILSLYFPQKETISPGDVAKNNCYRGEQTFYGPDYEKIYNFVYYEEKFICH